MFNFKSRVRELHCVLYAICINIVLAHKNVQDTIFIENDIVRTARKNNPQCQETSFFNKTKEKSPTEHFHNIFPSIFLQHI